MAITTLLFLVTTSFFGAIQAASFQNCLADEDCREGEFCYLKTNSCTPCIKCSAYMREENACAKEPLQCGNCLKGYINEIFSDGYVRELCVPLPPMKSVTEPQPFMAVVPGESNWLPFVAIICSVITLSTLTFLIKYKTHSFRVRQTTRHQCNDSAPPPTAPPPPPAPSSPPAAPPPPYAEVSKYQSDGDEEQVTSGYVHEREEVKTQMAGVFRNPTYARIPNEPGANAIEDQQPIDEIDGPPVPPNNDDQPFLIDENTVPSSWTPGPDYTEPVSSGTSGPASPLVTTFQGILTLSGPGSSGPTNHTAAGDSPPHYNITTTNITVINSAPSNSTGIFNMTNL